MRGYIAEIFRSIQGEGKYLGVGQVFLRMAGCSLACTYCDTSYAWKRTHVCRYRGSGGTEEAANPLPPADVMAMVNRMIREEGRVDSLSVTGGEPLEQPGFLADFLELFSGGGVPVYLETNGLESEALARVAPYLKTVSLDIKLPSLCGGRDLLERYPRTLQVLAGKDYFCKIVIARGFDFDEFERAVSILAERSPSVTLVIQPATGRRAKGKGPPSLDIDLDSIMRCYQEAFRRLRDVRVIPQCHRLLGVL